MQEDRKLFLESHMFPSAYTLDNHKRAEQGRPMQTSAEIEKAICTFICAHDGVKAREIAKSLGLDRTTVNRLLYRSPLMKELCWQDEAYGWHGLIRQSYPHHGLREICGYYSDVRDFLALSEEEWLEKLKEGCISIGRNLNDTRGLIHSFLDCRETMIRLFTDLDQMTDAAYDDWEIVFELKLKRGKYIRIYADVLVITENRIFSLEFKMKDTIDPEEVLQAAKYTPYLEIVFGASYDVIPVLVLTRAEELYQHASIGSTDMLLPVCSGDMLFNVFDEYMGLLG